MQFWYTTVQLHLHILGLRVQGLLNQIDCTRYPP